MAADGRDHQVGLRVKEYHESDDTMGLLMSLLVLSPVHITCGMAKQILRRRRRAGIRTVVAVLEGKVVGTCSVVVEPKLLRWGMPAGHIEDVAVLDKHQGEGIGKALVRFAISLCEKVKCYKIVLDCSAEVAPFYESLGFRRHENGMRLDPGGGERT